MRTANIPHFIVHLCPGGGKDLELEEHLLKHLSSFCEQKKIGDPWNSKSDTSTKYADTSFLYDKSTKILHSIYASNVVGWEQSIYRKFSCRLDAVAKTVNKIQAANHRKFKTEDAEIYGKELDRVFSAAQSLFTEIERGMTVKTLCTGLFKPSPYFDIISLKYRYEKLYKDVKLTEKLIKNFVRDVKGYEVRRITDKTTGNKKKRKAKNGPMINEVEILPNKIARAKPDENQNSSDDDNKSLTTDAEANDDFPLVVQNFCEQVYKKARLRREVESDKEQVALIQKRIEEMKAEALNIKKKIMKTATKLKEVEQSIDRHHNMPIISSFCKILRTQVVKS